MKMRIVTFLAGVAVVSGCGGASSSSSSGAGAKETAMPKTFFNRTKSYAVEPAAKEFMTRLEGLVAMTKSGQEPLTDQDLLPLYRETDVNRDHHISTAEAEGFYHEYIVKFEDAMGSVRVKVSTPPENK
jgi:hypothetical protein